MSIEVDVNGITVQVDETTALGRKDLPLYQLLRVGDFCEVDDMGVMLKGIVRGIVRLSKGKILFSVSILNNPMKDWGMFEGNQVIPANAEQRLLRMTSMDILLRKYEPKGMSTNVSIWT